MTLDLGAGSRVDLDKSVTAYTVALGPGAAVGTLYANEVRNTGGSFVSIFAFTAVPKLPLARPPTIGTQSISVHQHAPRTLDPGSYLDVRVQTKASLFLSGGTYEMRCLRVDNFAQLIANAPSVLRVGERVEIKKEASLAPANGGTARDLSIEVVGDDLCGANEHCCHQGEPDPDEVDEPHAAVSIAKDTQTRALLTAPEGTLDFGARASFIGAIAANRAIFDDGVTVSFEDGFGCVPASCAYLRVSCGVFPDGCGGVVNCGSCSEPQASCYGIDLVASQTHDPNTSFDAVQALGEAIEIVIPSQLTVTEGSTTEDTEAAFNFDLMGAGAVECLYRGAALGFFGCSNGALVGQIVTADLFQLHLDDGNDAGERSTVSLWLNAQPCNCIAATCQTLGASCGVLTDGCGGLLVCGTCGGSDTCGGDPTTPLECGCAPKTCADVLGECGEIDDGCGGTVLCGECEAPTTCGAITPNRCDCVPTTCADQNASCGAIDDGCGGVVDCGACDTPTTCGGGGQPNQCGCTPASCADFGRACGVITDGCGGLRDCGSCGASHVCDLPSGQCVLPEVFSSAAIEGAALTVADGGAPNQGFTVSEDPTIPINSLQRASTGPVVTVGPAVRFQADGHGDDFIFGSTERCTTLSIPYDRDLVGDLSQASSAGIAVYLITTDAGGPLLTRIPESQLTDSGAGTITWCASHLSRYVVASPIFCAIPLVSSPMAIASGAQSPANPEYTISGSVTFDRVLFAPPPSLSVDASNAATACTGGLLFYGDGGLSHVCYYDNSATYDLACHYPFDRRTRSCSDVRPQDAAGPYLQRRGCFALIFNDDVAAVSAALGRPPAFAGVVGGIRAWVDPLADNGGASMMTTTYHVSTWLVPGFTPTADVAAVTTALVVESHPHVCAQSGAEGGTFGDPCNMIADGCGSQIDCGPCAVGFECVAGACRCPASGCPNTVEYCGSDPATRIVIDKSNPCREATCNPAVPSVSYGNKRDYTPCSDNDRCSGIERCINGVCRGGVALLLSDGDPCTVDECSSGASVASHTANPSLPECNTATPCFVPPEGHAPSGPTELASRHAQKAAVAIEAIKTSCAACAGVLP
ncbi:MAG: hypothetical protein IT381_33220 [Deltaproteobacteria bacterium]|nr:hypothetical protein [Deltaproteobacteria bacterium]